MAPTDQKESYCQVDRTHSRARFGPDGRPGPDSCPVSAGAQSHRDLPGDRQAPDVAGAGARDGAAGDPNLGATLEGQIDAVRYIVVLKSKISDFINKNELT